MSNNDINPPTNPLVQTGQAELFNHYRHFSKEYARSLKDSFDKRFALIWLSSFLVHLVTILYFSNNMPPTGMKQSDIDHIQKQFATFLFDKEVKQESAEPASFPEDEMITRKVQSSSEGSGGSGTGIQGGTRSRRVGETVISTSGGSRTDDNYSGTDQRLASREQISQEVSSKGLLGLLTSSGSNAQGEAVTDVLGEAAGGQGDLDKVLGNLDGLKTSGKSTGGSIINQGKGQAAQKGTRSTESGGIDELLVEKGQVKSTDIQRSGNIVVEEISEIADERGIKSESRNSDKVSEVVNHHNSSIQYCYQRELKQNPDLKGKLVVRFTIGPDGMIKEVKVISSTLNSPAIERCVISRIKRWDDFGAIDPAKGDATFRQVYTFGY